MGKKVFRLLLFLAIAVPLALPFAFANSTYPKTASCPIDGGTAHATGKKRTANANRVYRDRVQTQRHRLL